MESGKIDPELILQYAGDHGTRPYAAGEPIGNGTTFDDVIQSLLLVVRQSAWPAAPMALQQALGSMCLVVAEPVRDT